MIRTVYNDAQNNEMDVYVNQFNEVYISVIDTDHDIYHANICLCREDVEHLISNLQSLLQDYEIRSENDDRPEPVDAKSDENE